MNVSESDNISAAVPSVIHRFPFGVLSMTGKESVDFLHRISTNDFEKFSPGQIRKTLLITDKGRILDTVWAVYTENDILILTSRGMETEVLSFLNRYVIMEDITIIDVSREFTVDVHFNANKSYPTEYFGIPASFEILRTEYEPAAVPEFFEPWRIERGIPLAKHEIVQDYNPLELNLWDWISFTKGCYIGQEVIARLDTYDKIQRMLCSLSSQQPIRENDIVMDEEGAEAGKITSVVQWESGFRALAVIKRKYAVQGRQLHVRTGTTVLTIENVFRRVQNGRN